MRGTILPDKLTCDQWKKIALWALDCHAATGESHAIHKSGSKSDKRRQLAICERALELMESQTLEVLDPLYVDRVRENRVRGRLGSAISLIKKRLME